MRPAKSSRQLAATQQEIWDVVADPEQMARWWPGISRMESVTEQRFTQVLRTRRGKPVRADFRVVVSDRPWNRTWAQELKGTPFARVLRESTIELRLEPADGGTLVTVTQHQKLRGYSITGGIMIRRATTAKLAEALDGLARITGG